MAFKRKRGSSSSSGLTKRKAVNKNRLTSQRSISDRIQQVTAQIATVLARPLNALITEQFSIRIERSNIAHFENEEWLWSDDVEYYFSLICEVATDCYAFSPGFFLCLMEEANELRSINGQTELRRAARFTRRIDLFEFKFVFIPSLKNAHFTLSVIDNENRQIDYYDSLHQNSFPSEIQLFVEQELRRHSRDFQSEGWKVRIVSNHPKQFNTCDCGVFICQYGKHIAFRERMLFKQVSQIKLKTMNTFVIHWRAFYWNA